MVRGSACRLQSRKWLDDTFLLDYSMFFGAALFRIIIRHPAIWNFEGSGANVHIVRWKSAEQSSMRSISWKIREGFWGFIDWTEGLDKQCGVQGVYTYCAKRVQKIAEVLGRCSWGREKCLRRSVWKQRLPGNIFMMRKQDLCKRKRASDQLCKPGMDDPCRGCWWKTCGEILDRVIAMKPEKDMVSPYMNHHFVGGSSAHWQKEQAMDYMKYYWGGMIGHGADNLLGALQSGKSCWVTVWFQYCKQLLPRMELHTDISAEKIFLRIIWMFSLHNLTK